MKLAFSTLACPDWSWDKILDEAAQLGYDAIEIRGIENEMVLPHCPPFMPDQLEKTRAQLRQSGLSICALDTSCAFHDEARYDASIHEGMATIKLAQQLNVPYIRVFGDMIPADAALEDVYDRVAGGLQTLGLRGTAWSDRAARDPRRLCRSGACARRIGKNFLTRDRCAVGCADILLAHWRTAPSDVRPARQPYPAYSS